MLNLYNLLCLGYFIADINSTLTAINVTLRQILKYIKKLASQPVGTAAAVVPCTTATEPAAASTELEAITFDVSNQAVGMVYHEFVTLALCFLPPFST